MLIFRQYLIHAGTSYMKQNFRLHFYVDFDMIRTSNSFYFVKELLGEGFPEPIESC